ncbi:MAG: hypothetical protein FWF80_07260 [Defluviitaleaceae bacterium]|nr:hypothetical protein [Defluviitaleaceae bacterium]
MLQKINDREIMTMYELSLKYPEHFIMAEVTETVDTQQNDRGYVMYIADTRDELFNVPNEEKQGKLYKRITGHSAEKPFSFGLMLYE